jgi:hypothetical protein
MSSLAQTAASPFLSGLVNGIWNEANIFNTLNEQCLINDNYLVTLIDGAVRAERDTTQ